MTLCGTDSAADTGASLVATRPKGTVTLLLSGVSSLEGTRPAGTVTPAAVGGELMMAVRVCMKDEEAETAKLW